MGEEWRQQLDQINDRTLIQPLLVAAQLATNPVVANAYALLATHFRFLQETALSLLKPSASRPSNLRSDPLTSSQEAKLKRMEALLRTVCTLTDLLKKFQ